jgi:uncharacterized protein YcbK (DUF882 family)
MRARHFTPAEFICRCGRPECDALLEPTLRLVVSLDRMREFYGSPIIVESGLRCPFWNARQGGEDDSEHLTGEGADLRCRSSRERWAMLSAALRAGITRVGIYGRHIHVGTSARQASHVVWLADGAAAA